MLSVIILVAVAIITTIVNFVPKHKETGLMGACWEQKNDTFVVKKYEENGPIDCKSLVWENNLPLIVKSIAYHSDEENEVVTSAEIAIRHANQLLGFEAFVHSVEDEQDILVTIGVPQDNTWKNPGGQTFHTKNIDEKQKAFIEISNVVDQTLLNQVIIHELLHALGLGHDDWEGSIMFSTGKSKEITFLKQLWVSDYDKKVLKDLYFSN
jgi:hypothetical protein